MSPEIEHLISLQHTDREIQRLKAEIAELPKRVAAIEEKLAGTKTSLEKARAAVKGDDAARRKYETAISDLRQKISKYRDQSLDVKTNEQYKALLHEIQFAEQEIGSNEDRILELMVNSEVREKEVKAAEAELKAETAEIEKEKVIAREQTAKDEKELAEWNTKRDTARGAVDPDLLRHYDRVLKFRGSGIAEVRDQKCTGCSVVMRPQIYNEVRGGKLIYCDSCQRILYFDPSKEAPPEQKAEKTPRRRAHPKIDASLAWYYRGEFGDIGEVFLSFVNSGGMAARRIFDAATGRKLGETLVREGGYRQAFPEDLDDSIRLNGHWTDAEQEEWEGELPSSVLDHLQRDLDLARAEAANHLPKEAVSAPSSVAS
ncbi:MAG TPA: C4-type zinc ribbon domain-containing protein [Terriglobales bacterium]|nr:C4-type zinc ribbon domain-containing protein [Terriglobales bacterium]